MKNILVIVGSFLLIFSTSLQAQLKQKDIVSLKVKSISELETDLTSRKSTTIEESMIKYDKTGNEIEIIERDNSGIIILHESYEYDKDGNKTVEIQYKPDGNIKKRHVYTYVGQLRTERKTYDKKGNQIALKKYIYTFHE